MSAGRDEEVPTTTDEDVLENAVVDTLAERWRNLDQVRPVRRSTDILAIRNPVLQGGKVETRDLLVRSDVVRRFEAPTEEFHVPVRVSVRTGGLLRVADTAVCSRVRFDVVDELVDTAIKGQSRPDPLDEAVLGVAGTEHLSLSLSLSVLGGLLVVPVFETLPEIGNHVRGRPRQQPILDGDVVLGSLGLPEAGLEAHEQRRRLRNRLRVGDTSSVLVVRREPSADELGPS